MNTFKNWLEQQVEMDNMHLAPQAERKVREIWDQIFNRLVGQQSRPDAVAMSLNDLTHARKPDKSASQAILDMVGPLLQQLGKVHPEYAQRVKDTMSWLGEDKEGGSPDRTLKDLVSRLFGDKYQALLSGESGSSDMGDPAAVQKAPPQPPVDSAQPPTQPDMPQPDPNDPNAAMTPQQPQVPEPNPMMKPSNPMPPQPAGAMMGLY